MVTKEEWAELDRKLNNWLGWRGKKDLEIAARKAKEAAQSVADDARINPDDLRKPVTPPRS